MDALTHIQPVAIRWPRLKIASLITETLATKQLAVLDLDRVFSPRVGIVKPPEVLVVGQGVRR